MPNYWGGEFGYYDDNKDTKAISSETDKQIQKKLETKVDPNGELEKRSERLQSARESIVDGGYLNIVDEVDISACDFREAGEGLYEVVYNGNIVGYAKDKLSKPDHGLGLN